MTKIIRVKYDKPEQRERLLSVIDREKEEFQDGAEDADIEELAPVG